MLDALVLSDRPVEHDALPCIFCRPAQRVLANPDRFDRNQDALGIEAVQDVGKTLALLADPVGLRNEQAVDEDGIGIDRLAAHFRNAVNIGLGPVEVGVEDRDAVGRPRAILVFGGPGQQHDLVGDLRSRGPDLLAMDEIATGNTNHHVSAPATSRRTQLPFCSGVPFTTIGCGPNRLMCTAEVADIPPPWLATSCIMIAASVTPRPEPPNSSGIVMPSQPASAIAR